MPAGRHTRAPYEGPYDRPGGRGRTPVNPPVGTGLQTGLGIASLVLGIVGLLIAFIPLVGIISLPVTGTGLLLGIIALIVGIARSRQGLAFPIAGSSVNAVAIGVALFYVLLISRAVTGLTEESKKKVAQVRATTLSTAAKNYYIDHGQYPQALQLLLKKDDKGGPYIANSDDLKDPWGYDFQYNPAAMDPQTGEVEPEISTRSPDGMVISNLKH
jgi:hypothetical protein